MSPWIRRLWKPMALGLLPILAFGQANAARREHAGPLRSASLSTFSETWAVRAPMLEPRRGHVGARLPDGRVLVAGGLTNATIVNTVEIYDPFADTWSPAPPMQEPRLAAASVTLPDGDVLVAGGYRNCDPQQEACDPDFGNYKGSASAERYDVATGTWQNAGNMNGSISRYHVAAMLGTDKVAVVGGTRAYNTYLAEVQIYDIATNAWSRGPDLPEPRHTHTATSLADGRILVVGGSNQAGTLATYTVFDGVTWTAPQDLPGAVPRWGHASALLTDGDVLVAGGHTTGNLSLASTLVYDPAGDSWAAAGDMVYPRGGPELVALADGTALVTGGCIISSCNYEAAQMTTATERWSRIGGWSLAGDLHTARLGAVLVALPGPSALSIGGGDAVNHAFDGTELYGIPAPPPTDVPPFTPTPAPPCAPLPTGIIAWWPFDEAEGTVAEDIGGGNHDGVVSPGAVWNPAGVVSGSAQVGGSLAFSSSPDTDVAVADAPALRLASGDFSIAFWVKFPANADTMVHTGLLQKRVYTPFGYYSVDVRFNRFELKIVRADAGHNYFYTTNGAVATGRWQHVAITLDRSAPDAGVRFFVDGSPVAVYNDAGDPLLGILPAFDISNTGPLMIGGGSNGPFVGSLDELQIFSTVLDDADVLAIVTAGSSGHCRSMLTPSPTATDTFTPTPTDTLTPTPTDTLTPTPTDTLTPTPTHTLTPTPTDTLTPTPSPSPTAAPKQGCAPVPNGLAAWWPLDEAGGSAVADRWGNHLDGVLYGPLGWGAGQVAGALQFTGLSTNFVEVPTAPTLDFGVGDLSFDAWVRRLPGDPPGSIRSLLDKRQTVGTSGYRGYHAYLLDGRMGFQLADGTHSNFVTQSAVPADGLWHHVAFSVARGDKKGLRVFLDGSQLPDTFDPTARSGSLSNGSPLRLGGHLFSTGSHYRGWMDDPRLYHVALKDKPIKAIFKAGTAGMCMP